MGTETVFALIVASRAISRLIALKKARMEAIQRGKGGKANGKGGKGGG